MSCSLNATENIIHVMLNVLLFRLPEIEKRPINMLSIVLNGYLFFKVAALCINTVHDR